MKETIGSLTRLRILTISFSHSGDLRIANCGFQTVAFLCAALACSRAVVLSGYNGGHGLSYSDYGDLDGYLGSAGYKVLPTVAVPVHAVSAAPLHVDASLDHELHGYKHHDQDHDYYVSISLLASFSRNELARDILFIAQENISLFFLLLKHIFQFSYKRKIYSAMSL